MEMVRFEVLFGFSRCGDSEVSQRTEKPERLSATKVTVNVFVWCVGKPTSFVVFVNFRILFSSDLSGQIANNNNNL